MSQYYFKAFNEIVYDGKTVKNILLRFRIRELIENRSAVYYTYNVVDGERADIIAHKYYGDPRLDWLIWLTNDIFDPEYDWPLSYENFINFIKEKYGSIPAAKSETHHYEWILTPWKKLHDGTIIEERTVTVDKTTYDTLDPSERREVTAYDYEERLNNDKATIKILDEKYASSLVREVEGAFD